MYPFVPTGQGVSSEKSAYYKYLYFSPWPAESCCFTHSRAQSAFRTGLVAWLFYYTGTLCAEITSAVGKCFTAAVFLYPSQSTSFPIIPTGFFAETIAVLIAQDDEPPHTTAATHSTGTSNRGSENGITSAPKPIYKRSVSVFLFVQTIHETWAAMFRPKWLLLTDTAGG